MAEYIERSAAIRALTLHDCDSADAKIVIRDIPAADVAPVVHGQWIKGVPFGFSGKPNGYRSVVPEQVMCVFTKTDIEFCVKNAVPVVQFAIFSHGMTINLSLNVRRRKRRKHGPEGLK